MDLKKCLYKSIKGKKAISSTPTLMCIISALINSCQISKESCELLSTLMPSYLTGALYCIGYDTDINLS